MVPVYYGVSRIFKVGIHKVPQKKKDRSMVAGRHEFQSRLARLFYCTRLCSLAVRPAPCTLLKTKMYKRRAVPT